MYSALRSKDIEARCSKSKTKQHMAAITVCLNQPVYIKLKEVGVQKRRPAAGHCYGSLDMDLACPVRSGYLDLQTGQRMDAE